MIKRAMQLLESTGEVILVAKYKLQQSFLSFLL